jgi:anaerobic dimethyl sulfoxide reductase subunit B (iron-sulfur subunit)/Tat-targeted selenate reductase subunit YnfG
MAVCPAEAITKQEDGLVVIDHEKCIQCRNCYYACPYGMIQISPTLNKPIKCDLCHDRIEAGINKEPICVSNCALQALYYGTLEDLQDERDREIATKAIEIGNLVTEIMGYKEA